MHNEARTNRLSQQRNRSQAPLDNATAPDSPPRWRTADGRLLYVCDMETAHLINCCAIIARTKLRREHGIREPDDLTRSSEELDAMFAAMMVELAVRAHRRKSKSFTSVA